MPVILVRTPHTAIVSPSLFEKVQALSRANARVRGKRRLNPGEGLKYVLSGKLRCPTCGGSLNIRSARGVDRIMECSQQFNACQSPNRYSMQEIERLVLRGLQEIICDTAYEETYLRQSALSREEENARLVSSRNAMKARIELLDRNIETAIGKLLLDERNATRGEKIISQMQDELDGLRHSLALQPTEAHASFVETQIPMLREVLDELIISAPLVPKNSAEQALRGLLKKIVRSVAFHEHADGKIDVLVCYDLNGDPDTREHLANRSFPKALSSMVTPSKEATYTEIAARYNGEHHRLDDREFRELSSSHIFGEGYLRTRRELHRPFAEAVRISMLHDTYFSEIMSAVGIDRSHHSNLLDVRMRHGFLEEFRSVMLSFRPHETFRIPDLRRGWNTRGFRKQLLELEHPILRHPHFQPGGGENRLLSDEQWELVRPLLPYRRTRTDADPNIMRYVLDAAGYMVRNDVDWRSLPSALFRYRQMFKVVFPPLVGTRNFEDIAIALLRQDGLLVAEDLTNVTKLREMREARRTLAGKVGK